MMIVPGLIGYLIDQKVGTRVVFTLLGLLFGMTGAIYQLIALVTPPKKNNDETTE